MSQEIQSPRVRGLVFVFPSRGGEWAGLGGQLYARERVFADAIDRCSQEIERNIGWSLAEELTRGRGTCRLHGEVSLLEPTLTGIQISLFECWRSRGFTPDAALGFCGGELAAGYASGVLTLEEAIRLACAVGRLLGVLEGRGALLCLDMDSEDASRLCERAPVPLHVAAELSPQQVVLAAVDLDSSIDYLKEEGIPYQAVNACAAYHSPVMDEFKATFEGELADLQPRAGRLPMYSAAAGGRLGENSMIGIDHWWNVVRQPARLAGAAAEALSDGYDAFLEMGSPMLSEKIRRTAERLRRPATCLGSLDPDLRGTDSLRRTELRLRSLVRDRELPPAAKAVG